MIVLQEKGDTKSPKNAPKKKRMMTPELRAANKANAQKSTGPKNTDRTRFNGVVHGMASREILFLAGEDEQEFWSQVDLWCQESDARTVFERECIVDAVYSRWVKRRVINSQVHAVNDAVDKIHYHFDEKKAAEVRRLIPDLKEKPDLTVTALMNTTAGCVHLITEFSALSERLSSFYSFEVEQRRHSMRVGGHRPKELFADKVVMELNRSYLGSLHGPGGFTAAGAANAFIHDQPEDISDEEFERRLEPLVANLPTPEEGHLQLQLYIKQWLDRLTERKELVEFREEREKKSAIGIAQTDVTPDGVKRERYLNQSVRTFQAAMRLMLAFKAERRKHGEGDSDEGGCEPDVGTAPQATVETEKPSEAVVTQVVGPAAGNADLGREASPVREQGSEPAETAPHAAVAATVETEKPSEAVVTQVAGRVAGNTDLDRGASPVQKNESEPGEMATHTAVAATVETEKPSEAVVTQVVGPAAGNNAVPAPSPILRAAASPAHNDPLLALIEAGFAEFDSLREFDHIE